MAGHQQTVHPHQPRFAQGVTGGLSLVALVSQQWLVLLLPLALVLIALLAPRLSPVNWLFRRLARAPEEREPVAPVRFSQWLAVAFLATSAALFVLGASLAGWVVLGAVALVALVSAISGYCIGCEIYRLALARTGRVDDLRGPLGLTGDGPWLTVLTAPGCARCGPVVAQVRAAAGDTPVHVVDLAKRPAAAVAPVKSVPAILKVAEDGRLQMARTGALRDADLDEVLS